MFEQFLKSGDYAIGGLPKKRQRQAMMREENPEFAEEDDEELAFKDLQDGSAGKRANTEAQF